MPQIRTKYKPKGFIMVSDSRSMNAWESVLDMAISEMRKQLEVELGKSPKENDKYSMEVFDEFLEEMEMQLFSFNNEFINHESETDQEFYYAEPSGEVK